MSAGYLMMPQAVLMASAGKSVHLMAGWPTLRHAHVACSLWAACCLHQVVGEAVVPAEAPKAAHEPVAPITVPSILHELPRQPTHLQVAKPHPPVAKLHVQVMT